MPLVENRKYETDFDSRSVTRINSFFVEKLKLNWKVVSPDFIKQLKDSKNPPATP